MNKNRFFHQNNEDLLNNIKSIFFFLLAFNIHIFFGIEKTLADDLKSATEKANAVLNPKSVEKLAPTSPVATCNQINNPKPDAKQIMQCLHDISFAQSTPEFPRTLFKTINQEEIYATHCYLPDGDQYDSYIFITSDGIKALKFPVYKFMIGIDHTSLPGDITHFKYKNKDFYINPDFGNAKILTHSQVPALASDLMKSMPSVERQFKKYEDYLISQNKLNAINVTSDPTAVESVMTCLKKNEADLLNDYMYGKFSSTVPVKGVITQDWNKFENITETDKQKYLRPFDKLKSDVINDILTAQPSCVGVIDNQQIEDAFNKCWGQNQEMYESLHKRYFPNNP